MVGRSDLLPLNESQLKQGHPALGIRENVERDEGDGDDEVNDDVKSRDNVKKDTKKSDRHSSSSSKRKEEDRKDKSTEKKSSRKEKKEPVWLRPGITVRIVSKSLGEKYPAHCPHLLHPRLRFLNHSDTTAKRLR